MQVKETFVLEKKNEIKTCEFCYSTITISPLVA